MNVLLLSAADSGSGATRAAYRLHRSFLKVGVDSKLLVQVKYTDDSRVIGMTSASSGIGRVISGSRIAVDRLPLKLYSRRKRVPFCPQWLPDSAVSKVKEISPDIVHLHYVNDALMRIESIGRLNRPIVWTLRDMWPFTGGCHYDQECGKYAESCGACPLLSSTRDGDLSRWVWKRKANSWANSNLTIVALSSWLAECAKKSSLFKGLRIETVPNGIDTEVYKPLDKQFARKLLKLPQDKKLILFGAVNATADRRKGFAFLQTALQRLSSNDLKNQVEIVVFGASKPDVQPEFGFKVNYLGRFSDDISLALIYSSADVFIAPSIQENLANTVLESLACGVPCVAFKIGGMPDLIEHCRNGYLAEPFEVDDLVRGIKWVLEKGTTSEELSCYAREKIEREFYMELPVYRYRSIFNDILEHTRS